MRRHILIVEDDETTGCVIARGLDEAGFGVARTRSCAPRAAGIATPVLLLCA